jgi:hypothetical protein
VQARLDGVHRQIKERPNVARCPTFDFRLYVHLPVQRRKAADSLIEQPFRLPDQRLPFRPRLWRKRRDHVGAAGEEAVQRRTDGARAPPGEERAGRKGDADLFRDVPSGDTSGGRSEPPPGPAPDGFEWQWEGEGNGLEVAEKEGTGPADT